MSVILLFMIVSRTWLVAPDETIFEKTGNENILVCRSLQKILDGATSGDTVKLMKGEFSAEPKEYIESICGNCENPDTEVRATAGFHIEGKSLVIIGADRDSTILVTNAGYGILFSNSYGSLITNLTITGGRRDPDGRATDAGIVGKNCRLTVRNVTIRDNTHRVDTVVVGIGGIFGREGSEIYARNNRVMNNGWDGITLYRGGHAVIADNVIRKGRGAGIGITWDGAALIYRNMVSEYWKGIGAFGQSRVICRNNAVFDNLGWGIIATGNSYMEVLNNVIYHNGNCGFAVWKETARGILKNNIIVRNGWKEEWVCPCVGVWLNADIRYFPVQFNNVWNNGAGDYEGVDKLTGVYGNISGNPLFKDEKSFRIDSLSPCVNSGDTLIIDRDATRSDMGIHGGPLGGSE